MPSSDEVRRRPLATGDFHRVTNETSKGSNARYPAAVDRTNYIKSVSVAEAEPIIEVVHPKRRVERKVTPVDDGEQIEEHAISGP